MRLVHRPHLPFLVAGGKLGPRSGIAHYHGFPMRRGSRAARRTFRPQAESLEPRCLFAALIHDSDLAYLGAFRLPGGTLGDSSFDFGGTALAYNPVNDSLFMVGHDW